MASELEVNCRAELQNYQGYLYLLPTHVCPCDHRPRVKG